MGALDILTVEGQTGGLSPAPFVPTGFLDVVPDAFDSLTLRQPFGRKFVKENKEFIERDDLIKERFGDPFELTGIKKKFPNPSAEGRLKMIDEHQVILDSVIEKGRETEPDKWVGIRTKAEIEESTRELARQKQIEFEETASKASSFDAIAGTLVGGIGASFTDPINLATLPFGAAAGAGILRTIATEALVNAGIEAFEAPFVASWQKELGHKYGVGDAVFDITTAGVGGGVFAGIIKGTGPAIKSVGSKGQAILDRISKSEKLPSEVRDAAQFQSRVAHIDEDIPVVNPTRDDVIMHRQAVQETQDSFRSYKEPVINPPVIVKEAEASGDLKGISEIPERFFTQAQEILEDVKKLRKAAVDINRPSELKRILGYTPVSLTRFIINEGGIVDVGGELKAKDITGRTLPGLVRKGKARLGTESGVIEIDNQTDTVLLRAVEEGYFPGITDRDQLSHSDLFDAIEEDIRGSKVYKEDDLELIAVADVESSRLEGYLQSGIDEDTPIEEVAEILADIERSEVPFESDMAIRPDNVLETMNNDVDIAGSPEIQSAFDADFERLLRDMPDFRIETEDGTKTITELSAEINDNRALLDAIRTCGIG